MADLNAYTELQRKLEHQQKLLNQSEGAYQQIKSQIREEFGCSIKEAKLLQQQYEAELEQLQLQYATELEQFLKEWGKFLE